MAKRNHPVGVGLFERKKDSGVPMHPPAQSGTAVPTDKKTEALGAHAPRAAKQRKYHGQQAK